jgi:hypothetical protein
MMTFVQQFAYPAHLQCNFDKKRFIEEIERDMAIYFFIISF